MRASLHDVLAALTAAGLLTLPGAAHAQQRTTFAVGVGVVPTLQGTNLPYGTGSRVQFAMEIPRLLGSLGLRFEAFRNMLPREALSASLSRHTTIPGASASLVLPLAAAPARVRPYLLAGGGTYRTELGGGSTESHFGITGGGGVDVGHGRVRPFAEARLTRIYDGGTPSLIPVTVGLRF